MGHSLTPPAQSISSERLDAWAPFSAVDYLGQLRENTGPSQGTEVEGRTLLAESGKIVSKFREGGGPTRLPVHGSDAPSIERNTRVEKEGRNRIDGVANAKEKIVLPP